MARLIDNGCMFTVQLSESDVIDWAYSWPCFGDRRRLWFQFDKRNGDLVDMADSDCDQGGLLALSHDAQAWGQLKLAGKRVAFCAELALRVDPTC